MLYKQGDTMKYALILCFAVTGFSISAHQNCLVVLLNKIKGQSKQSAQGYHPIGESKPILADSKRPRQMSDEEIEIPTLAQDPAAFARFYWGFELAFFDKI